MTRFRPSDLFTLFVIAVLAAAVYAASDWPLRASIIVIVLGSAGLAMATAQLIIDIVGRGRGDRPKPRLEMELPTHEDTDPRANLLGTFEIWGWLIGLMVAIRIVGLPLALPLFVVVYAKWYGARWLLALFLGALLAAFIIGVYQQIMHVYWPESVFGDLFLDELFGD